MLGGYLRVNVNNWNEFVVGKILIFEYWVMMYLNVIIWDGMVLVCYEFVKFGWKKIGVFVLVFDVV